MEWEPVEIKKEEGKAKLRGDMAIYELARRETAQEIARAQGRERQNPRLEALERAAQAWQRKRADDELKKRHEEKRKFGSSIEVIPIRGVKTERQSQDLGITGWLQRRLVQEKKPGRRLNAAGMGVMLRRAIAREKALALGRKLPDPHIAALEQEAARWREGKDRNG